MKWILFTGNVRFWYFLCKISLIYGKEDECSKPEKPEDYSGRYFSKMNEIREEKAWEYIISDFEYIEEMEHLLSFPSTLFKHPNKDTNNKPEHEVDYSDLGA